MALAITPLHPQIGAEIGGLDVSRPIDEAMVDQLWRAIDRHSVVVFHDQHLTDEQLELTQEFAWAGTQNVGWVAGAAVRHPKGHLKSIKEALGR